MSAPKHPSDLINNPVFLARQQPDPPVSTAMGHLMTIDGPQLDLMANINNDAMARAQGVIQIFVDIHGSEYIKNRGEMLKRLSNSRNALARSQIIEVIKAGGNLPAEFYQQTDKKTWTVPGAGANE